MSANDPKADIPASSLLLLEMPRAFPIVAGWSCNEIYGWLLANMLLAAKWLPGGRSGRVAACTASPTGNGLNIIMQFVQTAAGFIGP